MHLSLDRMKIYIDNVLIRFQNEVHKEGKTDISQDDLFTRLPELNERSYLLNNFNKEIFLDRITDILLKRPENPVQIIIESDLSFSPYQEISKKYDAEPAAGGLVIKNDEFLMIRRLGKWDLPKGKIEKGENSEEAALREVKEECGIIAKSLGFLCDTHHMYMRKGKTYIKKTSWYLMENIDDSNMSGQEEEGITEVNWFTRKMLETNLIHSYGNIEDVFLNYLRLNTQSL